MGSTGDPQAAWYGYLALAQYYIDRLGMKEISLYTNIGFSNFNPATQDPITQKFVDGLDNIDTFILGMGRDGNVYPNYHYKMGTDALVSHCTTRWDTTNIGRGTANNLWLINEIQTYTPPTRPAFMHVMTISWTYYPSDILAVATAKISEG